MRATTLRPDTWLVAATLVMAVGCLAFWEVLVAACLPWWVFALYGVFWSLCLLPLVVWRERRPKALACAVFWGALIALWAVPWNSRKPFVWALDRIEPGMTSAQVESIMDGYERTPLRREDAVVFRHSVEPRFDSDWGLVHFEEGRVVSVEFLPD